MILLTNKYLSRKKANFVEYIENYLYLPLFLFV